MILKSNPWLIPNLQLKTHALLVFVLLFSVYDVCQSCSNLHLIASCSGWTWPSKSTLSQKSKCTWWRYCIIFCSIFVLTLYLLHYILLYVLFCCNYEAKIMPWWISIYTMPPNCNFLTSYLDWKQACFNWHMFYDFLCTDCDIFKLRLKVLHRSCLLIWKLCFCTVALKM